MTIVYTEETEAKVCKARDKILSILAQISPNTDQNARDFLAGAIKSEYNSLIRLVPHVRPEIFNDFESRVKESLQALGYKFKTEEAKT